MRSKIPALKLLKAFESAARLGSFKQAAEELHVTPTAISHQMRGLEEFLGTKLFERKTRALALTQEGEMLAEVTHKVFDDLSYTINKISNKKNVITISTTSSLAAMWLIPRLESFYKSNPEINVSIVTNENVDDIDRDRRIDLAIRYGEFDQISDQSLKLVTESIGMYATPAYLSKIDNFNEAVLLETEWMNKSLPPITWETLANKNECDEGLIQPEKVRLFSQEHHMIQAALANQGIALVSSLLIDNSLKQGWLIPYENQHINHRCSGLTYYLVSPVNREKNTLVKVFTEWLVDEINQN